MTLYTSVSVPTLTLKSGDISSVLVDAAVIGTSSDDKFSIVSDGLTKSAAAKLRTALLALGANGAKDEAIRIPSNGLTKAPVIVAVGLGSIKDGINSEVLRRAAGNATRALAGTKKIALALPSKCAPAAGAVLEGAALGAYSFRDHRHSTLSKLKTPTSSIILLTDQARQSDYKSALHRARVLADNIYFARDVINTSPLQMPPEELVTRGKVLLEDTMVDVSILDEKELKAQGYGGITGVGQGSSRPPRLLRMEYSPEGATKHVVLIGKGITFDTGGISLKPPAGMHAMKGDMSGAAAVIATMHAIAELELSIAVTGYAACAENMPGGNAQRPGDIVSTYGGRTVEVLNTDAEGRLVMCDVLVRAGEDEPDVIIDISTLTGACVIALGHRTAGVMGDEEIRTAIKNAADRVGEEFWPLPMPEELRAPLDSVHADIANIGIREGGTLSAAWFLKEFVPEGTPWAHLDIAGPAFHEQAPYGYTHKGGVGFGIRTMLGFIEDVAEGTGNV